MQKLEKLNVHCTLFVHNEKVEHEIYSGCGTIMMSQGGSLCSSFARMITVNSFFLRMFE